MRIKELKRIECTLSQKRWPERMKEPLRYLLPFTLWLQSFDDRNHAGLPAESKLPSDQFLRPVSPMLGSAYLSKLRRDSIGTDFQSVRKLTNYVCAKPLESRLSAFRKSS